jgi:hypothetical protein
VTVEPLLARVDDWKSFITGRSLGDDETFHLHDRTGSRLGDEGFVGRVSKRIERDLMPRKPGRKKE